MYSQAPKFPSARQSSSRASIATSARARVRNTLSATATSATSATSAATATTPVRVVAEAPELVPVPTEKAAATLAPPPSLPLDTLLAPISVGVGLQVDDAAATGGWLTSATTMQENDPTVAVGDMDGQSDLMEPLPASNLRKPSAALPGMVQYQLQQQEQHHAAARRSRAEFEASDSGFAAATGVPLVVFDGVQLSASFGVDGRPPPVNNLSRSIPSASKFRRVGLAPEDHEDTEARAQALRFERMQQQQHQFIMDRLEEEQAFGFMAPRMEMLVRPRSNRRQMQCSESMEPAFPRRGSEDAVGVALDEASGLADAEASAQFALRPNGHISLNRLAAAPSPGSRPLPPPLPSTARRFAASSPRPVLSTAARSEPLTPIALSEQTIQSTAPLANQILPPTRSLHPRIAEVVPHPVAENEVFEPSPIVEPTAEVTQAHKRSKPKSSARSSSAAEASSSTASGEPKRRCGRKSMNYSSEQKRERNRAAVKKCRQRQALKFEYLQRKAEVLVSENQALSDMLVKNVELDEEKRRSLTRGIQMDILLKIKEIFTQSLPKDFVIDADSIWDLNSVLAVSMPSRCYYGIESIKDFWRTSLRMRNKGKIRSFWAWLFRLPPGDRFSEFTIEPFSATSNLYFVNWTTKSTPPLSGSMVIMFGLGHRVTLHVECFGWLIWRYLLTNEPFPESPMD